MGGFLAWLGLSDRTGPHNAGSSHYALDAAELVGRIGQIMGKKPVPLDSGEAEGCGRLRIF